MREILFRGQTKSDKKWIYGNLLQTDDGVFIIQNYAPFDGSGKYEVIPETVCQYTGYTDDTGKKIFEGDIVSFTDGTSTESGFWETCCCGEVGYDEEEACFYVSNRMSAESWEVLDGCHIIGNIFDNPELIGDQP